VGDQGGKPRFSWRPCCARRLQWAVGMFKHNRSFPSFHWFLVAPFLALAVCAAPACGLYSLEFPEDEDVEQVVLKIAVVPSDVRCIRVIAAGPGRTVERELETSGAATLSQSLAGLPLGTVTFIGEAFTAACTAVTKSTIAAWTSQPVQVSIVLGRLANVELVMVRNGRAKVDITFTEEGACTQPGAACRVASECCSKKCESGLCARAEEVTVKAPPILP
jgi:hypothetical protein